MNIQRLKLVNKMKQITIVFDNTSLQADLEPAFGFACVIELDGKKILFDTGSDGSILIDNMLKLNHNPEDIECVVISHDHWDHNGGLKHFTRINRKAKIFLPSSFSADFVKELEQVGLTVHLVSASIMIAPGLYSTGEIPGAMNEQSLIIESNLGGVLLTGCAHPGIVKIVQLCNSLSKRITTTIGGFHLKHENQAAVESIVSTLKSLGVKHICPTHCTGEEAIGYFKEAYNAGYIQGGVGQVITIK